MSEATKATNTKRRSSTRRRPRKKASTDAAAPSETEVTAAQQAPSASSKTATDANSADTPSAATGDGKPKRGRRKLSSSTSSAGTTAQTKAAPQDTALTSDASSAKDVPETPKKSTRKRSSVRGKSAQAKSAQGKSTQEKAARGKSTATRSRKKATPKTEAPQPESAGASQTADRSTDGDVESKPARRKSTPKKTSSEATKDAQPKKTSSRSKRGSAKAKTSPQKKSDAGADKTRKDGAKSGTRKKASSSSSARKRRQTPAKPVDAPAVRKEMVISVDVGEQRVAVIEDDAVVEVYLERRGRGSVAGNIYKGVVDNVLPGMEASFVDIGLARNGFLYVGEIVVPDGEQNGGKRNRRIQDLIARGEEVLVQAVKDPMGTKGARLTTEISLPGRFVVFVPHGEGIGISRRLDDEERDRLKKLCRGLDLPEGGIIVRTAAEGASEEELRGDLALLRKLWATILGRSNRAEAPTLVYREAELPLRLVRDLFIRDFERLIVDHEATHRRLVGYLKRTSPELAARVELDAAAESILRRHGVEEAMRSTIGRNVPLPSGGSLVFDYAEALTVIDVNTGRFVGSKGAQTSLEDTITQNNLEAAREIVRQIRLRDIGGIIVIDFIDMSNAKNRKAVEKELARELARDRTKTYVVEISPLGLVEMTRQNVTDGPREILTVACPTCTGDGVVLSEETMVIDVERALRSRARSSGSEALLVELNERTARQVIGPGGDRLADFEADVGKRVFVESRTDVSPDFVEILAEGTAAEMELRGLPVSPGDKLELALEDVYLLDDADAIGRRDGYVIVVSGAGRRVGDTVHVVVDRVTRTAAYASTRVETEAADATADTLTAEAAIGVDGAAGELDDVELAAAPTKAPADDDGKSTADGADGSSDGGATEAQKPASKRRRRRRKATPSSADQTTANDGGPEQAAAAESDPGQAQVVAASENGAPPADSETDGPKKPSRRRRRRGSRTNASRETAETKKTDSTGAGPTAEPEPPADAADARSASKDGKAATEKVAGTPSNRRRRRSTRSKKPTDSAANSSDSAATPSSGAQSQTWSASEAATSEAATPAAQAKSSGGAKPAARKRRRRSTGSKSKKPADGAQNGAPTDGASVAVGVEAD